MNLSTRQASTIFIEVSGRCNARCPYCAQHRLRQGGNFGGIMSPALLEQILDYLFKIGIFKKDYTTSVYLFNWGEPFLNPEINKILQILDKNKVYVGISSNFIMRPDIEQAWFSTLSVVVFSLSGFSQENYGRIHGALLDKVINNFEDFYKKIRICSPKTKIIIAWHRYLFNEDEFWKAYKYFNRPGISFIPEVAFLNDGIETKEFLKERLPQERIEQAQKDLFLQHTRKMVAYHKKKSKNYHCPAMDYLVIDEIGQLLTCCGFTRYDSDYVLGNILEMSAEEIWKHKNSHQLCNECISSGLARWSTNMGSVGLRDKPWPSGGGLYNLKLWSQRLKDTLFIFTHRVLGKLPNGAKIIRYIKNLKKN